MASKPTSEMAEYVRQHSVNFLHFASFYDTEIGAWNEKLEEYETNYVYEGNVLTAEQMYEEYLKTLPNEQ